MVARNKPNEIYITRQYDAPLQAVWEAWTDPEQVAQWWGPRGFTLTTHSKDLRPGGVWHYTMHGLDGVDYPNHTLYHEVEPLRKLVYDHGGYEDQPPLFRVTVLFSEAEGKTTMDMTMTFPSPEDAKTSGEFIKQARGNSTWDRLAEYLGETQDQRSTFVINRSFVAAQEVLYQMWTDPEHFCKWLPPVGFEMEFISADFRAGGQALFRMFNSDGVEFFGKFEILQMQPHDRFVYVQRFCDAQGNLGRHPGTPVFPEALQNTVDFTTEDDDATRVTVATEAFGPATAEEVAAFEDLRSSMTEGWTGSLDKLESKITSRECAVQPF